MHEDARTEWIKAAGMALDGIPPDLLATGARAAMLKADHPSKIIPLIMEAVGEAWRTRVRINAKYPPRPVALPAPVETEEEKAQRLEVAAMMAGLVRKLDANA